MYGKIEYDQIHRIDENFERFMRLIDKLLVRIEEIPFQSIINDRLLNPGDTYFGFFEMNSYVWRYTADSKFVNNFNVYSFRFPNACHTRLYHSFEVEEHYLFELVNNQRHRFYFWYKYKGTKLLQYIADYLDIASAVTVDENPYTQLFVNQAENRVDMNFYFDSINTKVTITFEPGSPESFHSIE